MGRQALALMRSNVQDLNDIVPLHPQARTLSIWSKAMALVEPPVSAKTCAEAIRYCWACLCLLHG